MIYTTNWKIKKSQEEIPGINWSKVG